MILRQTRSSYFLASFTLILFAAISLHADSIDDLVRERMKERNIPGAAVAVVKNGKPVKVKGYGLASLEFSVPVTTETVFEIGSVSKQMTAAAIMLLVEDGNVSLDEKISTYLPNTPEAWMDVTVRHLLTHTSGIMNYTSLTGFELSRRVTIDGFIKQLAPHPLEFTPGERNTYSNSGYNLLAYIIQTQSGKPYMEFLRERIFLPLGMTKTGDRDPQFIIPFRAAGYEWRIDRYMGRDGSLTDLMGAGSITSTINDMVKWEAALRGDKFLKPESKREMWTQFTFNNGERSIYGFGWRLSPVREHKLIGHTGQTAGFGAAIFRYVDQGVTVIALTNLGEIGTGSSIATSVAKRYVPTLSLRAIKGQPVVDPNLGSKLISALQARNKGVLDPEYLGPELIKSLSTDRAKAIYRRIANAGSPNKATFVDWDQSGPRPTYRYLVEAGKRLYLWRVAVDEKGLITELILEEDE